MTPIFQRIVDKDRGDCQRAAVASLLDLAYEDMPDLAGNRQSLDLCDWLETRGLCAIHLDIWHIKPRPDALRG